MRYLRAAVFVSVFWLLLSGHYTALILGLGVLSVLIVTWFLRRMDKADGEAAFMRLSLNYFFYLGWLFRQVVLSNIDVARRIWAPSLPIQPSWQRLDTKVSTPLEKTLYANSITLTPGTLTTEVKDDHFMIHSLSPDGIADLRNGEMEARIRRLGI